MRILISLSIGFVILGCSRFSADGVQNQVISDVRYESFSSSLKSDTTKDAGLIATAGMARNIILMIGDGMGITQVSAGMYSLPGKMALEEFSVIGLHKCYASNDLITDSAAGATAFACGVKTYKGAVGVGPDTSRLVTILEEAESRGLATGLVATSSIVDATPACFIAHSKSRKLFEEIATFFLETEVDLIIGGGKKYFDQRSIDDRNLYEELEKKDYVVSDYFQKDFVDIEFDQYKNLAYFTADEEPQSFDKGRDYLVRAAEMSPDFLKSRGKDAGFFLMIEASQIEAGGRANNRDYIISEMKEFDRAIRTVLDFVKRDGETFANCYSRP